MSTRTNPIDGRVEDYLRRLDRSLRDLPKARRRDLLGEVRGHIRFALAEHANPTELDVLNILERMGDPSDIASEAMAGQSIAPRRVGPMEVGALVLLPIGGFFLPILGWLAGVVLLWSSSAWKRSDKVIGTLFFPGGILFSLLFPIYIAARFGIPATSSPIATLLFTVLLTVPFITAGWLGYRLRRRPRPKLGYH